MESQIWLWAYLCSREVFVTLESFEAGVRALRSGAAIFSDDFFELCPELRRLREKYSRQQLRSFYKELCQSVEKGILLLYPGHPFFPATFKELDEVPFLIRMLGSPIWMGLPGLSIVGHREPSMMSLCWMDEHLSHFFQSNSCFSVSGGARGVDQKAHMLSLRAGRPTVAFIPSGLESIYPHSFANWVPEILSTGGALISEYENQRAMQKHFFAQRNRLISALGCATLIIEARRHSGTLLTAREAIDQSRPLWVLPGHPMDPNCQGSLDLLFDGATAIHSAADLSSNFQSEIQGLSYRRPSFPGDLVVNQQSLH